MVDINFLEVIAQSRAELRRNVSEREDLDKRINELRTALRALIKFMPESERAQVVEEIRSAKRKGVSLAESIIDLLSQPQHKAGLSSGQIREKLEESGFDLEDYSQPLAAVMTTLQRLVDQKRVTRSFAKQGEKGVAVVFKVSASQLLKKVDGD